MDEKHNKNTPPERRGYVPQFLGMMVVYLLLVYGWALIWAPPDCVLSRSQIVYNLMLLYGCMVAVFFLTRYTVRGPWWLGALAATLMMAHPLIATDVLAEKGANTLVFALYYLLALMCYSLFLRLSCQNDLKTDSHTSTWMTRILYCATCATVMFAMLKHCNFALFLTLLTMDMIYRPNRKASVVYTLPFLVIAIAYTLLGSDSPVASTEHLPENLLALPFLFMPLPYTDGTMALFASHPVAAWGGAVGILLLVVALLAAVRHKGASIGMLGLGYYLLFNGIGPVDLGTAEHANTLLLPLAFFNIAVAALCLQILQHPKWRSAVIGLTTGWALVFFVLRIMRMYGFF